MLFQREEVAREYRVKILKNLQEKPIIEWSISAALESKCFDRILVSTDDEEIASISESIGAEVPFADLPIYLRTYTNGRCSKTCY